MPKRLTFEVVPIFDVPVESGVNVGDHEPLQTAGAYVSAGSSGALQQEAGGFEVCGLPRGQRAFIRQERDKFHVMLEVQGGQTEWLGNYSSVDDALQALSDKLMPGLFL